MSIEMLQDKIRAKKTPVALVLSPVFAKISQKITKNFQEMFGSAIQAYTEPIRYHCGAVIEQVAGTLPAVVFDAAAFLRYGSIGMEVLENLVNIAKVHDLYTIVNARTTCPDIWLSGCVKADGVTALPYLGQDGYQTALPDKSVFVVLRTANPSAFEVQELMAGDRKLFAAVGDQVSRRKEAPGALIGSDFPLDVKDLRRRMGKTFFLLTDAAPQTASYAFDDFGHGALLADDAIQWADDPAVAAAQAVAELKKWVIVA